MIDCSIGIMAYNEEQNVGELLNVLLARNSPSVNIAEIIVVASGCTDTTINIVQKFININKKVKLLIQAQRTGKISAINYFLKTATSNIVALINADVTPRDNSIERLMRVFLDAEVGMSGGRIIPVDRCDNLMGFAAHLLWSLHHSIALKSPKLGEAIAYRRLDGLLFPEDTIDDEGIVEATMLKQGFKICYVPTAIFYNVNPQRIKEFVMRRRNIYAGHLQLKDRTSYLVSTIKIKNFLRIPPSCILKITDFNVKLICWTVIIAFFELWARILGAYDFYIKKRDHRIWEIAATSKRRLAS
jgi:poly-beta-1,6-N-acetyl-D-glucosamine synthase